MWPSSSMFDSASSTSLLLMPFAIGSAADLANLHKHLLELEVIDAISDEMRELIESEWPELVHKLPPRKPQS